MENTIKIKRTAITLAQKVQIILKLNDPSFKQKEIAREYGLTASAISKIVKKKEEILEEWLRGGNLERKRKREGKNQTIDDALLSWFWTASKEEGPISGPVLMAKAKALAEEMGIEFKPTNGWLCRWKNRNNLAYKRTPKEKGEPRTPDQWTGFPLFMPPSHYLQEGPHVADFYGDGVATQRLDEAEEDGPERSAGGTEEQESQFYLGAERFPPAPAVHQAQWQTSMTSDSSSDEMPATHPLPQQGAATPSKHKRIKQEQCSLSSPQPGHSCQFYTAPSDLRGQREMPGTSNEPATSIQSKGERGKREEDHRSLSYQYYKSQPETVYTSDSSDTSSDETASARTIIHRATGSHHSKRIKQESSAQPTGSSHSYSFYTAPEELRDAHCAPCSSSSPSDEIMRTKTPIYRTVATRTRQERILQEEDSAPIGRPSQSLTSFKGKQTLSQVLHQLGAHRLPRGSFIEIPVTHPFDIPAETPHSPYGGHVREDSIPKRRNQFYKGENSRKAASSSTKRPDAMLRAQEESLKKSEQAVMVILRNVYFSGKEMLPNSSTEALNDLCLIQGVGDLSTLLSDKHMSYQADKSIGEFQQAMAEVIEEGILTRVQSANCFSILVDQSHSFPEQSLLLYVRIIEQVAGGYEPKTYFLALKQMGEATAGKITAEIAEMLKGKGLNVTKMCGMAIDGVSITTENKHEVVTQLKARVPGILSIHCIAHRLALSSVSAADTVTYLVKYQHMLASVYKYFANVLASKEGLEAMLKILRDSEKQSSPFKETSPQWLTIRASIEAVIRNFGCLVSVLRSNGSAMAVGLAKSMCTYKFLHCSHFLADILHQLYILCKSYHTSRVDFSIAHSLLKSTVTTISKLSNESSGEMLKTFLAALPARGWDDNASFFTFQSHQIKGGSAQRRAAESICRTFAQNLMEDLKARFSEPGDAVTMTAMTAIFDPAHASDFKSQHIQTVTNYLSSLSSESDKEDFEMSCKQELVSFMNFVESQPGVNVLTSARDVCELALKQKLMFPTVSSLAERFLALPITTGELVKGFSREAALQSKLGNSLSSTSLENLLKISIHGPPIKEFSFRDAYLKWVSSKLDKTLKPKS